MIPGSGRVVLVAVFLCGLWGGPSSVVAQSDGTDDAYVEIDDLFSAPDEETADEGSSTDVQPDEGGDAATDAAPEDAAPAILDIAALTTAPTKVTGSVSASAGANLGFNEWPDSAAAAERTPRDLLEASAGYTMSTSVTIDSRPEPYLRYRAKLSSSLNPTSLGISTP
ncbi:MAG: hypothetical protein PF508_20705, partial [Spirochaeta sp.]|nr:hypothetical protein [Spirochaeta sp.]